MMPIIKTVSPDEATGDLAMYYRKIKAMRGSVGNNAMLFSSVPELLRQQMDFVTYYANHPTLPMSLLAAIRVMVSDEESCGYCTDYNTMMLVNMAGWTPKQVSDMRVDVNAAPLEAREKALLTLVLKSVRSAHDVSREDIDALRKMGWDDAQIFDAVHHGARMLSTDILLNTFKIEKD